MRKKVLGSIPAILVLLASRVAAAPCAASDTALCLNASRFHVAVHWQDTKGRSGDGQAVALTTDTGYFWFFNPSNIELVVKVLDARTVNGKYWVFFGALSNVQYDLTVTDSVTGAVKTYHNPQNQFASVGDTDAFAGSAMAPPTQVTALVVGSEGAPGSLEAMQGLIDQAIAQASTKSAADFTPCHDAPFGFNLNGCRFHIEVNWEDSHGRIGIGHPVQLTDDTGYFWFFADTNVELVVKVLDARSVNGNFWVFFGALSNVKYSVAVTDSLTKTVKRYANPQGVFASVGDTAAFVGGRRVAPVRDASNAVSADLDVTGGSFTAVGADGTTYTLDVPPHALLSPETITLTPVTSVGSFPFSGGFHAGVEIEPEGLSLVHPAMLTIHPAAPLPPSQALTYAYAKGGEEFILYPRFNDDADFVQIPLLHFSGYGEGGGGAGDASTPSATSGLIAPYMQRIANWKFQELLHLITHDEFNDHVADVLSDAFEHLAVPLMENAKIECDRAEIEIAVQVTFDIVRLVQLWGFAADPRLESVTGRAFSLAQDILTECQQKTFDKCVYFNDPFEATLMLYIAQQLQEFGVDDPYLTTFIEGGLMERCLRFEIDFESRINEEITGRGTTFLEQNKFRAHTVPLRLNLANPYAYGAAWEGSCTLSPELTAFQYTAGGFGCTATLTAQNSLFNAPACWVGILSTDASKSGVKLVYDPGEPAEHLEIDCHGAKTITDGTDWSDNYETAHKSDFSTLFGLYFAGNWDPLRVPGGGGQNGEFFAKKLYDRSIAVPGGTLSEETIFFLKHTPDKELPTCP